MAFLENGAFCSLEEYADSIHRRANETQLQPGELYTLMMRLEQGEREAAKKPIRTIEIAQKTGLTVLKFVFLNNNLETELETKRIIRDGFMATKLLCMKDPATGQKFPVQQGYLKDYFDDQFGSFLATADRLLV